MEDQQALNALIDAAGPILGIEVAEGWRESKLAF